MIDPPDRNIERHANIDEDFEMQRAALFVTPVIGPRYWAGFCIASVLGADSGDFCSRLLGLGYWRGLPVLAALFALVLLAARRSRPTEVWYWIAIIIVRAAATNLSDLQTLQFGLPFSGVMASLSVLLAILVILDRRNLAQGASPIAGCMFWVTMLVAGTLGTAIGDDLAFVQGLHPPTASVIMTMVLTGTFLLRASTQVRSAAAYWLTVVVIRTWGTNFGDFSADVVGVIESTAASGIVLLGLLLTWRTPTRKAVAPVA